MRKANLNHRGSAGGAPGGRRRFLKASITAGGAAAMLGVADRIGAPFIGTAKGQTTTWKIQTSWPGGIGLQIFKDWCNGIVEKTGGELAFQPFGAQDVVGDFQLFDAVKNGVLDAMNPFTLYWAGRMPASDRKSVVEGKSVSVRLDLGGRRISKKQKNLEI